MNLNEMGKNALAAAYELQKMDTAKKNEILKIAAAAIVAEMERIIAANEKDIEAATKKDMHPALIDRLKLDEDRIKGMAEGLQEVIALPDPVGELLDDYTRPSGLHIRKIRVPLGVIGIIYESRPNVTVDAFGLCIKSGNAVILKGGSEAINSNREIVNIIRAAIADGHNPDILQIIDSTDRAVTAEFMKLNQYIDVLIPRGGAGLIQTVLENSTIPVIETGTGNCHIYVDESADIAKAIAIIVNAKTQRPGVCNACESLVVHEKVLYELLKGLVTSLSPFGVKLCADEAGIRALAKMRSTDFTHATGDIHNFFDRVIIATEEDFAAEYLDYILSLKTVANVGEAIKHVNRYNTKHSDAIIAADEAAIARFANEVDAACVYINTSTRFTDGNIFGLGAEIGISNQKLHARGPMGLSQLTSYKYVVESDYLSR
ncbi:MAG: glutamate-5-semialdehyde dehydrogenase [Lachnospiraceae bacterium]|jgi:glutamate-5-semialdehyde dehydrogenase|nr:glutamate-5-semialdehyde dehydrogenase [Lachnospiraceae bacterium]